MKMTHKLIQHIWHQVSTEASVAFEGFFQK